MQWGHSAYSKQIADSQCDESLFLLNLMIMNRTRDKKQEQNLEHFYQKRHRTEIALVNRIPWYCGYRWADVTSHVGDVALFLGYMYKHVCAVGYKDSVSSPTLWVWVMVDTPVHIGFV